MSERKLVTIQTISNIEPHPDAERLEVAQVLGWRVVVKKGEFKPQDKVVFCEVDSVLPDRPEFEFLRTKKFRIKTIKLRGKVSQGICFPTSILKGVAPTVGELVDGMDITESLGVKKYEEPVNERMTAQQRGNWPSFLFKTDQTRIQAVPRVLTDHAGVECYVTEKVDGSSMTVYTHDGEFGVCSRNLNLMEEEGNMFWAMARKLDLEAKMTRLNTSIAVQGELVGPNIQQNRLKLSEKTFLAFRFYLIGEARYANYDEYLELLVDLGINSVPILDILPLGGTVDDWVARSQGTTLVNLDEPIQREGIVVNSRDQRYCELLEGRLSFKVINPDYLLTHDI